MDKLLDETHRNTTLLDRKTECRSERRERTILKTATEGNRLVIYLEGSVDSLNATEMGKQIREAIQAFPSMPWLLDAQNLQYIASAGLRVLLTLKKEAKAQLTIRGVPPQIYETLSITGFTELMEIHKRFRRVSTEGCEVIGQGANGKVYRLDQETILKTYYNPDALPEIRKERELARTAFLLGIPTAISYDVVRVDESGYGSVYELLNAKSYAELLNSGEKTAEEIAQMSAELLKLIHRTEVKDGMLPKMKQIAAGWAEFLKDYLPEELSAGLCALIGAVPEDPHMLHGDYHVKNVLFQKGESLLIDMDTICTGHPVFELGSMFNAYVGFGALDPMIVDRFLGIPHETASWLWHRILSLYLETEDEERISEVENKAKLIGYTRIMRRTIRRYGVDSEEGNHLITYCREQLEMLLPGMETLVF